jgi:hypothetical protein
MDGWMDGWMGGWMDGWMDGWISRSKATTFGNKSCFKQASLLRDMNDSTEQMIF